MQDWLIWIGSTAFVALISFVLGLLKDYNEVAAGFVALFMCILVMIYILPMAF